MSDEDEVSDRAGMRWRESSIDRDIGIEDEDRDIGMEYEDEHRQQAESSDVDLVRMDIQNTTLTLIFFLSQIVRWCNT